MKRPYFKEAIAIGLPVMLQSIFQASYSLVDELMVGKLGTDSIAGGGLGAKYSSLVAFTVSSVAAAASILISQYYGKNDRKGENKSFFYCSYIGILVMLLFTIPTIMIPDKILSIYTPEQPVIDAATAYLRVIGISYIPMTLTLFVSSYLRSVTYTKPPMFASVISMGLNVVFNYLFIFGKCGLPKLGLLGAGYGTLISRSIESLILIGVMLRLNKKDKMYVRLVNPFNMSYYKKVILIILPILLNEFSWSIGENIYGMIYGRMGKQALAATTLLNPLMGMFIGMFSGLSTAAGVMVGKRLGDNNKEEAYSVSKYLIRLGVYGSLIVATILVAISWFYVGLFDIEPEVAEMGRYLIYALAIVITAKILNMVMSGGVLRSGGATYYTLITDLIGTWIFGVPLALLSAYVWKLPVYLVYLILSQEEVIRLIIGFGIFKRKKWMRNITN